MGTSTQPVETVAIVDLGNDIQLTYSVSGIVYTLNKLTLRIKQTSKAVFITNADGFNNSPDNQVIPLNYFSVSSPVYTSNDELYAGLIGMAGGVALGGGASAGGGASVWSTAQGDFVATMTASTKNITVTGLPWTLSWENVSGVKKQDSSGEITTLKVSNVTVSGNVITLGDENDFEAGDTVSVTLTGPDKAYDEGIDSQIVSVLNPDSEKWTSPEHLVDISAIAADTFYYVIPMEGYKDAGMHWKFTGGGVVTMTLWATNNADADDTAITDWVDISGDELSKTLTVSAGTIEFIEMIRNIAYLKLMVRLITTGTGNAADIYIKKKAL